MSKKKVNKRDKINKRDKYNREIIGIFIVLFGIMSAISLISDKTGIIGVVLRSMYFSLMGFGGYIFPLIIIATGILFIINKSDLNNDSKSIYLFILFLCFIVIMDIINGYQGGFTSKITRSLELSQKGSGGGIIGSILGYLFVKLFGSTGSYIILSFTILIVILLFTEVKVSQIVKNLKFRFKSKNYAHSNKPLKKDNKENSPISNDYSEKKREIFIQDYNAQDISTEEITKFEPQNTASNTNSIFIDNKPQISNYIFPPIDILKDAEKNQDFDYKKEIIINAKKIEETMRNFGIDSKIIQIDRGPTITCYELQPAPGVKVNRIVNLSNDLALSLAASDIRIVAPIPGKAAVGIEVPNKMKDNVSLKEIIQSDEFLSLKSDLPLSLGKDITGRPIISSIDEMPHLLIAGATGSGKSVCINTIIVSLLYKAHPNDVKLLLIDPKVVELSIYNGIPHLLVPVVTEPKKATTALNWAVNEMERRYKLFAKNNVRDIKSYNAKFNKNKDEKLSKIVIIIDELADLMMVSAQEIEDYICRLAQMARAAGMYLIIATQRPSVDVITGTIKANIPSRISFAVSSQIDSRTILDMTGAEKLLGKGDMLFYPSNLPKPIRVQGAFISDKEVKEVVDFLKSQNEAEYDEEILTTIQKEMENSSILENADELLPDAISLVVDEGQASISLLQRKLKIGYARAARIIDQMEERGIIGGYDGSKPRKVLISKEDIDSIFKER